MDCKKKPNMSVISLKLLQECSETFLKPFSFTYYLSNGQSVELIFEDDKFCHLLGIETIAKARFGKHNSRRTKSYRGFDGYQGIKDRTITFSHLKSLSGMYKSVKDKFIFFYLIPHIIESPEIIIEYIHDSSVSFVKCKIMIFDRLHGVQVHLGIEIQNDERYFPRTFLLERLTSSNNGTRFTDNQPNRMAVQRIEVADVATGEILRIHNLEASTEEGDTEDTST